MGADCATITAQRPAPLGIAQDSECVTWGRLVELREMYNEIWEMLNECGVAEGVPFGDSDSSLKHEIDDLPTIGGFFRLEVSSSGDESGGTATPVGVKFILSGGTLLSRVNDTNYDYFAEDSPFSVVLKDPCNNCTKFYPGIREPAAKEVACPAGGSYEIHAGFYAFSFSGAPEACNIPFDWAGNLSVLHEHTEFFAAIRTTDDLEGCNELLEVCCGLYDKAHYEEISPGVLALKYIDIFVQSDGVAGGMLGYLTTPVRAVDLEEIKDRFSSVLDEFAISSNYICDKCNGGYGINPNPAACASLGQDNLACDAPLWWNLLIGTQAVAGYTPAGGGDPVGCNTCSDLGGFLIQFTEGQTICACDWEELASAMQFVLTNCCVLACGPTDCPPALNATILLTTTVNQAGASAHAIGGPDDKYYRKKIDTHGGRDCTCSPPSPATEFNCDYDEIREYTDASRVSGCGTLDSPTYRVDPEDWFNCVENNCGEGNEADCDFSSPIETTWEDEVTLAEVAAFAEGQLGSPGDCASSDVNSWGVVGAIRCGRVPYGSGDTIQLADVSGVAFRGESVLSYSIQETTLDFVIGGPDAALVTGLTLHWKQNISGTITNQSTPFSSGAASVHVATSGGSDIKTVYDFYIT